MAIFSKDSPRESTEMAKEAAAGGSTPKDGVISIIGPGMVVKGDCETEGTMRVEGRIEGTVRAGKAVVVSKDGIVEGDVITQDAIIGGRVNGTVIAESRLELQATCHVDGEIRARRIKLDEGGRINGNVRTGEMRDGAAAASRAGTGSTAGKTSGQAGTAPAASAAPTAG